MAAACELVELVCGQTRILSKKRRDFHLRYNTPHLAEVGLNVIKRETPAQDQWVDEGLLPTYSAVYFLKNYTSPKHDGKFATRE